MALKLYPSSAKFQFIKNVIYATVQRFSAYFHPGIVSRKNVFALQEIFSDCSSVGRISFRRKFSLRIGNSVLAHFEGKRTGFEGKPSFINHGTLFQISKVNTRVRQLVSLTIS